MKRSKTKNNVNASSMADIAFLLLIFFLVSSTIAEEKGIKQKLPEYSKTHQQKPKAPRNVLTVLVNKDNRLMVEDKEIDISELREIAISFITNFGTDKNFSNSPQLAVISLQNDVSTSYNTYIEVYNEIEKAYNEIWNKAALKQYGKVWRELNQVEYHKLKAQYPRVISEAEPNRVE